LRGYEDPQPRSSRRPASRNRTTPSPSADLRDEPRRRPTRNRPETRDSVVREPQDDYPTGTPRDEAKPPLRDRYGYEEPNSRPPRRRPATPARDAYDEWDDAPKSASRPRRPATPPVDSYDQRNNNSVREDRYPSSTEPRRRPNPADLGRSYEPEEDYPRDDLASSYDDSDLGKNYDDEQKPIPGDYVVDYQPLEDVGTDYSDDDYDDSEGNNYDDYDEPESDSEQDGYNDYDDRPERRKPINLNNDYD
jgi:hypothetical protein